MTQIATMDATRTALTRLISCGTAATAGRGCWTCFLHAERIHTICFELAGANAGNNVAFGYFTSADLAACNAKHCGIGPCSCFCPDLITGVFVTLFVLYALLYGGSFALCLLNNPDALRSEKYVLNKLAIEHRLFGDSNTGVSEIDSSESTEIEASSTKQIENKS
jgi:hypothetical protein